MIGRLIAWSARNLILIFVGTAFVVGAGVYALRTLPLDAIPDLSDVQAIVYTEYSGQAPQVVEDQVTYPLTSAMLTVPRSKVVRGFSFFGVSFVYIIFEDGVDIYWARSRVLEYLSAASKRLPTGVTPVLGPDATGVGWVYQYAVVAKEMTLAELRSIQDWTIRYGLAKAEGVAEVASVGGFVKQYNVVVDPNRLRALGIPLSKVRDAIRASNIDVGGRTVELSEFEFIVRGRGYLRGASDLEGIVLRADKGTPLLLKDIARVELGPDERRGVTELNGEGEVASGIALQRYGANALTVIDNIKSTLAQMASSLPKGVEIVSVYDRSQLIHAAIETLKSTLFEESAIVALVCVVFLLHVRSALVAIIMLPIGVLMAFAAMKALGTRLQHHEFGWYRHRHRRDDRCGHRHDRERAQASRTRSARKTALGYSHRSGDRGRTAAVLQPPRDHGFVLADLHARSAGGTAIQSTRLHQDVRHGVGGAPFRDARAGADGDFRAGKNRARGEEPHQSRAHLALPADHTRRAEGKGSHHPARARGARRDRHSGAPARQRIHAQAQ